MKIAAIDVYPIRVAAPQPFSASVAAGVHTHRSALLVRVMTDAGLEGWGETEHVPVETFATAVKELLEPVLLGKDPTATRTLWNQMQKAVGGSRNGLVRCVSALDTALWDLKGQIYGKPIAALLGADTATRFPAVAAAIFYDPRQPEAVGPRAELARRYAQAGYLGIKMKIGGLSPAEDLRHVASIREAIGPEVMLAVDGNWAYTVRTAVYMAKRLSDLGVYWFEEPLPLDQVAGYRAVSAASSVLIAGGQDLSSAEAFVPLLEAGALHLVQPSVGRVGGFTELERVVALAKVFGARYSPPGWGTGVFIAASLQMRCAAASAIPSPFPDLDWMEYDATDNPLSAVVLDPPQPKKGYLEVPSAPGLGVHVNLDAVRSLCEKTRVSAR